MTHTACATCTHEDNCIACSGWDDLTWDTYEANLAKKEKHQKAAERSALVSSEDSVNMFPDSAKEDSFEEAGERDVKSVVK